jgi:hypothetical protein
MLTNLQATMIDRSAIAVQDEARQIAAKLFDLAYLQSICGWLLAKLSHRTNNLRTLSGLPEATSRTLKTVIVPLAKIVGTEDRSEDFDTNFRPLKNHIRERWIGIAAARQLGIVLPAVELVKVGDEYYVRDGHHRISVARMMGQLEIDARIVN